MSNRWPMKLFAMSLLTTALVGVAAICGETEDKNQPSSAVSTAATSPTAAASPTAIEAANSAPASGGTSTNVRAANKVNEKQGWALTNKGLAWTDDAGATWSNITPAGIQAKAVAGVWFRDAARGWLVAQTSDEAGGALLAMLSTDNGGKDWSAYDLPRDNLSSSAVSAAFSFSDAEHGWVMVRRGSSSNFSNGVLFRTTDGGKTWTLLPPPPISDPVVFISSERGWLAGGPAGDNLFITRDGGQSWEAQSVDVLAAGATSRVFYGLPRLSAEGKLILPVSVPGQQSELIFSSDDNGDSWRRIASIGVPTKQISVPIPTTVLDDGTVIVTSGAQVERINSDDGSLSEQPTVGLPTDSAIWSLAFLDATQGWAVAVTGSCHAFKTQCDTANLLYSTDDGGATWRQLTP